MLDVIIGGSASNLISIAAASLTAIFVVGATYVSNKKIEKLKSDLGNNNNENLRIFNLIVTLLNKNTSTLDRSAAAVGLKLLFEDKKDTQLGSIIDLLPLDAASPDFDIISHRIWEPASSFLRLKKGEQDA